MEEYLTTKEIASVLKVDVVSVRRWINSGKLPATFLLKEFRVKQSDLEKFLNQTRTRKNLKS